MSSTKRNLLLKLALLVIALALLIGCTGLGRHGPNGDTADRIGLSHFVESGQRLPAWLAIGQELHTLAGQGELPPDIDMEIDVSAWYEAALSQGLSSLCDEWFIPGFIEDDLSAYAPSVAYAFVRHLDETGQLEDLVALYMQTDTRLFAQLETLWEAEQARARLWADFTGGAIQVREIVYQYFLGEMFDNPARFAPVNIEFTALAERAYYFFTPSGWSRETVEYYIEVSEESIAFVGDFLGYHHHEPLLVIYRAAPHNVMDDGMVFSGGGWYLGLRTVVVFAEIDGPPHVIAHEVAHAILDLHPEINRSNFPNPVIRHDAYSYGGMDFFEEGLCVVIDTLFLAETENDRFALEMSHFNFDMDRRATWEEWVEFIHRQAIWTHTYLDFLDLWGDGYDTVFYGGLRWEDLRYRELFEYYTAASFMLYLLEHRGTQEDFFRIYADITSMEEVYGLSMEEMIAQWLVYLDSRAE